MHAWRENLFDLGIGLHMPNCPLKMPLSDPILCQQGHGANESSINDKNDWKTVSNAFSVIDFTEDDLEVWVLEAELPVGLGLRRWF